MSVTRSPSVAELDKPKRKRRIGSSAVRNSRTMADLSRERIDRLQLLAILPDDVLEMVNEFLSFYDTPVMAALGRPFTKRMETSEYDSWLRTKIHGENEPIFEWARRMRSAIPVAESVALCKRIRAYLGSVAMFRDNRVLLTAALHPFHLNNEKYRCDDRIRTVVALCAGDLSSAVKLFGATGVFTLAVDFGMFEHASSLVAAPFHARPNGTRYFISHHRHELQTIFVDSASRSTVTDLCSSMVQVEHHETLDLLLSKPVADHIDVLSLLHLAARSNARPMLAKICARAVMSKQQLLALFLKVATNRNAEFWQDELEKKPHNSVDVACHLIQHGKTRAALRYINRIKSSKDALNVLNQPKLNIPSFIHTLTQLPVFLEQVPESRVLDQFLATRLSGATFRGFQDLVAMGAVIHDYPESLFYCCKNGFPKVLLCIIESPAVTDAHITQTVCRLVREFGSLFSAACIKILLHTGRVDPGALIVETSLKISNDTVSREVHDYYRQV